MCRGTEPWRCGRSNPLYQRALEALPAGVTLSRTPRWKSTPGHPCVAKLVDEKHVAAVVAKSVATGAICGCLWDIMGCHGGQWVTIVKLWDFRVLGDCGKKMAVAFGTKQDQRIIIFPGSQNIAAK